jgi:hypothetical protein
MAFAPFVFFGRTSPVSSSKSSSSSSLPTSAAVSKKFAVDMFSLDKGYASQTRFGWCDFRGKLEAAVARMMGEADWASIKGKRGESGGAKKLPVALKASGGASTMFPARILAPQHVT